MQHAADRPLIASGAVLAAAALVGALVIAPTAPAAGPAASRLVALTGVGSGLVDSAFGDSAAAAAESGTTGLRVADLDTFLEDIGLGTLVTHNFFELETESNAYLGLYLFLLTTNELLHLVDGTDFDALMNVAYDGAVSVVNDVKGMFTDPIDFGTDLNQLYPLMEHGVEQFFNTASELFLLAPLD